MSSVPQRSRRDLLHESECIVRQDEHPHRRLLIPPEDVGCGDVPHLPLDPDAWKAGPEGKEEHRLDTKKALEPWLCYCKCLKHFDGTTIV